uniref:VOC domain-containing protein n=1 Tax=Kalanchoe fedtschenkoi TaxID=63787 RepID=A0A7N0UR28_KALFE
MEKEEVRGSSRDNDQMKAEKNKNGVGVDQKGEEEAAPLMALNHVSRLCRCVKESMEFYRKVLGFVLIERPPAFDFDGAWLFNYGIGIHLVQSKDEDKLPRDREHLDPMDNHISFQCEDMGLIEERLKGFGVKYMKRTVEDEQTGTAIDQLFFNDPDGFMVEICNCENLKLVPAGSLGQIRLPMDRHNPPLQLHAHD